MDISDRFRALSGIMRRLNEGVVDGNTSPVATAIDDLTGIAGIEILPLRRKILRPDDLLSLDVTFHNMRLTGTGTRRRLVRRVASRPSLLVVRVQGQAIGEREYIEEPTPEAVDTPVPARLSGPSQLAFRMPTDATGLDFTVDAILEACRLWPMALDPIVRLDRFFITPGLLPGLEDLVVADTNRADPQFFETFEPLSDTTIDLLREAGQERLCAAVLGAARRSSDAIASAVAAGRRPDDSIRTVIADAFEMALKSVQRVNAGQRAAAQLLFESELTAAVMRDPRISETEIAPGILSDIGTLLQIALAPHAPNRRVTAIEAPYRIIFAPLSNTAWEHAKTPVTHTGRTEIWHTRLARRISGMPDETVGGTKGIRPFWTPDYGGTFDADGNLDAPNSSLLKGTTPTSRHRSDIVRLTAGYNEEVDGTPYDPRSIPSRKVMLSTLGAALDFEGNWQQRPTPRAGFDEVNVSQWRHISNWSRDNYVRVVEEGFLMPFGHRAAFITITERKFENMPGGGRGAYLRTIRFIILRERSKSFPVSGQANNGRDFPLTEVEILTEATPPIDLGDLNGGAPPHTGQAFVPRIGPRDYLFQVRGTDLGGRAFSTAMPLTFIFASAHSNSGVLPSVISAFGSSNNPARDRRRMPTGGSEIQFATITSEDSGDVVLPTDSIEVGMVALNGPFRQGQARFAPFFAEMDVVIPSLKKLASAAGGGGPQAISYRSNFLQNGFGPQNPAMLFAELVDNLPLDFSSDTENAGAFFEPNMGVEALSAVKGAVGDVANVASGVFDPSEFFSGAKVLGSILIEDLLNGVTSSILGDDAPEIFNVELESPPRVEARLKWDTTIANSAIPLFVPRAGGQDTEFDIDVQNTVFLNGDPPTTRVQSTLTNFKVNMFGFVILWFDKLEFIKEPGKKPDVNPDLHPEDAVVFGGPLEFVNTLSDIIPDSGFSDPPVLDVSPAGIVAGYDLDIPNVQVGVLSLTNMSLGARLRLPFDGDPVSVRFNFSEREDPFNLTISLLGGGGFFAIGLDSGGVREIEAALEFGAAIAFDIGVASGGVYVKAGIYFHWLVESGDGMVELTGYVEMGGELSVLGLITVSVTFYLALSYHKSGGVAELRGTAKLTIEIEILFFSTSVELQVERRFGGSDADPKFIDFIPDQATWNRYAAAFA